MTSKWPMRELQMLISQRTNGPSHGQYVLPLFFKLAPADLTLPKNIERWRLVWEEKADSADCAKQWECAVMELKHINGECYVEGTSEGAYIKKVVERICTLVPPPVPYDCSQIQGRQRLEREIATKFERLDASRARMVGLHGVDGLGKITLCKVMVNYNIAHYSGRSFLLEFPSPGSGDKSTIVNQCKKALEKFTAASDKHLLSGVDDFDQVVGLMRDRVGRHDVFLAVDNVWEKFLEEAKRVLGVGFSPNSTILVTSRSKQVLKHLLQGRSDGTAIVDPLPALNSKEAFDIFGEMFEQHDNKMEREKMNQVLERCKFSGSYHALALKALATHVNRVCMGMDSTKKIGPELSRILEEIISLKDHLLTVQKVIRLSYDSVLEERKRMFLYIAIYICKLQVRWRWRRDELRVQEWVHLLYWKSGPVSKTTTTSRMNELSLDGLIQIEEGSEGEEEVGLHDLYRELASREIATSPRFLVGGMSTEESVKNIEWKKLEIMVLEYDEPAPGLLDKLEQEQRVCPELRLLRAVGRETRRGFRLNSKLLPSLTALTLEGITEDTSSSDSGPLAEKDSGSKKIDLDGFAELRVLQIAQMGFVQEIAGLGALRNLQRLQLHSCGGLQSLDGLAQLQVLDLSRCGNLINLPDMRHLTCLQRLHLFDMHEMEVLGGLPSALEQVSVFFSNALERMPHMSSLTCLRSLVLFHNYGLKEVGGDYFGSSLTDVIIRECPRLERCPSLDACKHLESLRTDCAHILTCSSSVQNMPNMFPGLRSLSMQKVQKVTSFDVGCLTNLEDLFLAEWEALEEVVGLCALCKLRDVTIRKCPRLKKLDVVRCPSLVRLWVDKYPGLEELQVEDCESLRKENIQPKAIHSVLRRVVKEEDS